ncbi:MAG: PilZ domain-containing protein [Deltaproteobacteria bacterium]|nr:PilZ domain-containing protein [Deltaproteobacteria bacterium]
MDKRAAVRVPVRVRAQCKAHGLVIDGLVEDVSRSGLFLRATKSVGLGSSAEISIDLPGEATVKLTAEVVRIDDDGMALRFVDGEPGRRPLANFIMKQHATVR